MYNQFVDVIQTSTEKHIPHKTLSGRWNAPWVNRQIKRLIRKRNEGTTKPKYQEHPKTGRCLKNLEDSLNKN